jgi:hypothetical protein
MDCTDEVMTQIHFNYEVISKNIASSQNERINKINSYYQTTK